MGWDELMVLDGLEKCSMWNMWTFLKGSSRFSMKLMSHVDFLGSSRFKIQHETHQKRLFLTSK